MEKENKIYLGDGAYAAFTGYSIELTAENGYEATDTIVLEAQELAALFRFCKKLGWSVEEWMK